MPKQNNRRAVVNTLLAGALSAISFVLTFPPFSFWGFAFLIPIPLFAIARSKRLSPKAAAFYGSLGALPGWISTHIWVSDISFAGIIPLVIQLGLYTFLFLWLARHLIQRVGQDVLVLPILWVAIEFFRGSLLWGGYPWYQIAHPLIDSPMGILAMPASWGGVYLVSYLTATYSIILMLAVTSKTKDERTRAGIAAGGIFTSWILAGFLMIPSAADPSDSIRVGVVQPDVPQDIRLEWTVRQRVKDWLTLRDLTIAVATDPKTPDPVELIVWPEGFVPGWTLDPVSLELERSQKLVWSLAMRHPEDVPELTSLPSRIEATMVVDEMLMLQQALNIPMLVGSVAFDNLNIVDTDEGIVYERDAMYNSAFMLVDGEPQPVWYDKLHLTPFGEVMPLISNWRWLEEQLLAFGAQGMDFVLDKGKSARVLSVPVERDDAESIVTVATPICFEGTISSVCRKLVFDQGQRQAGLMVNMTNDGWFGQSRAGRESHLLHARWRCIELNTPMVRCANTGISCVINHKGQVINRTVTPIHSENPNEGYLIADVTLGQGGTVFSRTGELFGWVVFLTACIWTLLSIFQHRKSVSPMCITTE